MLDIKYFISRRKILTVSLHNNDSYLEGIVASFLFICRGSINFVKIILRFDNIGIVVVKIQRCSQLGPGVLLLDGFRSATQQVFHILIIWKWFVTSLLSFKSRLLENMIHLRILKY